MTQPLSVECSLQKACSHIRKESLHRLYEAAGDLVSTSRGADRSCLVMIEMVCVHSPN